MTSPLPVYYTAFQFVTNEKAQPLADSKGKRKDRLYLSNYEGVSGGAKIAVAAKLIPQGSKLKLSILDRNRYFIYEGIDPTDNSKKTYYKINKNSLLKRTGLLPTDLITDKDGKAVDSSVSKIQEKIGVFEKQLKSLMAQVFMLNNTPDKYQLETFEKQFINCLATNPTPKNYGELYFYNKNTANTHNFGNYNDLSNIGGTALIIMYDQDSALPCHTDSPSDPADVIYPDDHIDLQIPNALIHSSNNQDGIVTLITVNKKEYDAIMAGKPLSSRIQKALNTAKDSV